MKKNKQHKNKKTEKIDLNNHKKPEKQKIAFVCQRYGLEVNGGAEAECRMYAERLVPYYDVEVITTCALDYTNWENHYPEGESRINGVTVRRFPVERTRDQKAFDKISQKVIQPEHSDETEKKWMDAQGPYSPGVMAYLNQHGMEYEAVLFMTYLYYTTFHGIQCPCKCKILIPTAHDEWPIYMRQFQTVYDAADRFIYNAPGEKRFVEKRFPSVTQKPNITVGAGVDYPKGTLPNIREKFGIDGPYLLYSGRIDESKGCKILFDYFQRYQAAHQNQLKLVLTGKAAMPVPKHKDILSLGFVSEEEKYAVMKDSFAFVLASEYESLSIVVLESMMMGRPVLVNGKSEVLKDHCTLSNAGFYFYNYEEFEAELDYLLTHQREYDIMCQNGKQYVNDNYRWDKITERIRELISL